MRTRSETHTSLRVLLLEDSPIDTKIILRELSQSGMDVSWLRVQTENEFRTALDEFRPDIVLTDCNIPGFSGAEGLAIVREKSAELPVIFVSGTIDDDHAIDLLKLGATDYVLKHHLSRLCLAVSRALHEVELDRRRSAAEARYRDTVENAVVGICQVSRDGRYLAANPALAKMYGFESVSEMMEAVSSVPEQVHINPASWTELMTMLERNGQVRNFEVQLRRKDGRTIIVSKSARAIYDRNSQLAYYEAFVEDVSRRKELEGQMLRAQRMENIGMLAGGVAHDLNNILSPILMVSPMLYNELSMDQRYKIAGTIEMCAERGAQVVRQVLAFGRGHEPGRVPINPGALLNELVKIITETFPRNITVTCSTDEGLRSVQADPTQIHQVLLNLCVNARDAMSEGGFLRLHVGNFDVDDSFATMVPPATPGPHVVIEVMDTGTGIPGDVLGRIFDPFFTTKPQDKGTGLGLPSVRSIVEAHGGFVQVQSKVGDGTKFKVFLPAEKGVVEAEVSEPNEEPVQMGNGELVLVVDDEKSIRIVVRSVLESHGYRTVLAGDGAEALAKVAERGNEIAIILTDLMMPFMDGIAFVRALKKLNDRIPVVAATAHVDKARLPDLEGLNVKSILNKPFRADVMLRVLYDVLHAGKPSVPAVLTEIRPIGFVQGRSSSFSALP